MTDDLPAKLEDVDKEVIEYKQQRYYMLLFVLLSQGILYVSIAPSSFMSPSYLLDQLHFTHDGYGIMYLTGGALMILGQCFRSTIPLRVIHSVLAGVYALLSFVIFTGLLTGHAANSIGFSMYAYQAWSHLKAGQSLEPLKHNFKRGTR
jgi:hypothetical protein